MGITIETIEDEMIIHQLDNLPDFFKQGFRGIMLLHRNKDGALGNAQRKCIKRISSNITEWNEIVLSLYELKLKHYPEHRIYASVNERNIDKAIHEFQRRTVECMWGARAERDAFYCDIENRFFSCLMNPNARNCSNFLIDCDTPDEYLEYYAKLTKDIIIYEYPTKNGTHIITKPFNPKDIQVPFKKDELLYVG